MKKEFYILLFLLLSIDIFSQSDSFPIQQVHPGSEWSLSSTTFKDSSILPTATAFCNSPWMIPSMPPVKLDFTGNSDPFPTSGLPLHFYLPPTGTATATATFYQSRTPFTSLQAQFGSGNEQYFSAMHSQSISERTNFTVNVARSNGEGLYLRQAFFSENYSLSFFHRPKKNRYAITLQGQYQSLKKEENGGLAIDSLFSENIFTNRKLIPVNLDNASSKIRSRSIRVDQYFIFSGDSVWNNKRKGSFLRFGLVASDEYRRYTDLAPDTNFYPNIFIDSTATNDSVSFSKLMVDLVLSLRMKAWHLEIGGESRASDYWNLGFDTVMVDHAVKGSLWRSALRRAQDDSQEGRGLELSGMYIVSGPSKGNAKIDFKVPDFVKLLGKDSAKAGIGFHFNYSQSNSSPWFYEHYHSNHYTWPAFPIVYYGSYGRFTGSTGIDMFFDEIKATFGAKVQFASIDGTGNFGFSNFIHPILNAEYYWATISVEKKVDLAPWFFEFSGEYNHDMDKDFLPLPEFQAKANLYWQKAFKGKKRWLRLGISGDYFSAFYPGHYNPALGLFTYEQEELVGDYIYPSLYLALRVGPAHVYVKADHVTAGLFGTDYYVAPGYPAADRLIRFGLSWKFYD